MALVIFLYISNWITFTTNHFVLFLFPLFSSFFAIATWQQVGLPYLLDRTGLDVHQGILASYFPFRFFWFDYLGVFGCSASCDHFLNQKMFVYRVAEEPRILPECGCPATFYLRISHPSGITRSIDADDLIFNGTLLHNRRLSSHPRGSWHSTRSTPGSRTHSATSATTPPLGRYRIVNWVVFVCFVVEIESVKGGPWLFLEDLATG